MTDNPVDISDGPVWEPEVDDYAVVSVRDNQTAFYLYSSFENVMRIVGEIAHKGIDFHYRSSNYCKGSSKYPFWVITVSNYHRADCLDIIEKLYR